MSVSEGHGSVAEVDPTMFFGDDPDLALVNGEQRAWIDAHPCECDDEYVCEEHRA